MRSTGTQRVLGLSKQDRSILSGRQHTSLDGGGRSSIWFRSGPVCRNVRSLSAVLE